MADETGTGISDDDIEIDLDHPWVQAALAVSPQPTPASAQVVPVQVPGPEGKKMNAAMLTTVSLNSVMTVFLPPKALLEIIEQASTIFEYWDSQQQTGLVVANKGMQHQAQAAADAQAQADKIIKESK